MLLVSTLHLSLAAECYRGTVRFENPSTGLWYAYFEGYDFPNDRIGPEPSRGAIERLEDWTLAQRFVFPVSGLCIPGHTGEVWSFQLPGERWECGTAPLFRSQAQAREGKRVALGSIQAARVTS